MVEPLLRHIAPHYCCSCERIGTVLCEYCKYDISSEQLEVCLVCRSPVRGGEALCKHHVLPYSRAWCAGERSDSLQALIDAYKFDHKRETYQPLGSILDAAVPTLPADIVVVPVPTIKKHIRQRGFDHTEQITRLLAKKRKLTQRSPIERIVSSSQFGKSRRERHAQAKVAFRCTESLSGRYLLVDDVFTTGATLEFAAKALRDAGAEDVWVAVIARQPLEK